MLPSNNKGLHQNPALNSLFSSSQATESCRSRLLLFSVALSEEEEPAAPVVCPVRIDAHPSYRLHRRPQARSTRSFLISYVKDHACLRKIFSTTDCEGLRRHRSTSTWNF
ncbi:hypothetical protein HRR83_006439 [Exophiala dermatitidis]|uniref:Uncharacterized protein n=1 Tax=Exophiala dermatitidis TaxID=5970 RepID=A0AAN6EN72_EXODE|nr:hypothetical protein HRR73_008714 [Exophiala dermatitidis]KAJ4570753.1 hypothetical protein HRR79_003691 [Exophiala dermatitidis]KAJ4593580.1 hypothetical protein HRR83_006439 [Exophiala dermatitidis]KAJ4600804.1 hypothetical protein HRR84_002686 [Exophiala dermatitidis]KAJ4616603.1 hypothetical protein HRR88_007385 [Exophiala dermatitidis]